MDVLIFSSIRVREAYFAWTANGVRVCNGTSCRCSGSEARWFEKLMDEIPGSAGAVSLYHAGSIEEGLSRSMPRMNFVIMPHDTPKM
jgi:hypothetical protein